MIAAMAENGVIGKNNSLPWSVKGNLAHFKEMTMGWPCIMGRKTWESLPKKPLPGRLNIIISKSMDGKKIESCSSSPLYSPASPSSPAPLRDENPIIFSSLSSAIEFCTNYERIFICGGESIYKQAMPLANKIDLTLIPGNYDGDAFFPEIDCTCWKKTSKVECSNFSIVIYEHSNQSNRIHSLQRDGVQSVPL